MSNEETLFIAVFRTITSTAPVGSHLKTCPGTSSAAEVKIINAGTIFFQIDDTGSSTYQKVKISIEFLRGTEAAKFVGKILILLLCSVEKWMNARSELLTQRSCFSNRSFHT